MAKLHDKITQLTGDINWTIDNGTDPVMSAGASWGHEIHVTVDTPKIDAQNTVTKAGEHWQMDGVTLRRMRTAMAWVEPSGTLNPHEIVVGIRKRFKKYTLVGDQRIDGKYKHPSYLNNYEGGAWPMVDYMDSSGECQAMCRLQHGILRQLGFAVSDVYVVWAEPGTDHGSTAQEGKLREDDGTKGLGPGNGSRDGQRAFLVDDRVEVGKSYSTTTGPGLNRYEACLVVKDTGETLTTYYGGGAGVYKDKQAVLEAFWGLVWIRFNPVPDDTQDGTYTVIEIVKRYQ